LKKQQKVVLFIWGSNEHYWSGWQGFVGVYKSSKIAFGRLISDRNKQNSKAQIVEYDTLKVISTFDKKDNRWTTEEKGVNK